MAELLSTEMLPKEVAALHDLARGTADELRALIEALIAKGIIAREDLERHRSH
jgi:hypothetical protein